MADEGGQSSAAGGANRDIRWDYLQERVVSTLKVQETAFQKLINGDQRWA